MKDLEKENQKLREEISDLKRKISSEIKKSNKVIFQQSKMASLGEMLGNIAHQWRQPLMELSSITMELQAKVELLGKVSNKEIIQTVEKSNDIIKYMSQTIDDFRNFFAKDKKRVQFKISEQVSSAINMINSSLKKYDIKLEIIVIKNSSIVGFKNEYSQVLINILSNAKDELVRRKIKDPKIILRIGEDKDRSVVEIEDNAGGIKIEPIEKVFEPFYTKNKVNGTGVGLFMSKLIVENNMDGRLLAKNTNKGAKFIIVVPKSF